MTIKDAKERLSGTAPHFGDDLDIQAYALLALESDLLERFSQVKREKILEIYSRWMQTASVYDLCSLLRNPSPTIKRIKKKGWHL